MSQDEAYEVQVLSAGQWRPAGSYDDKSAAVIEAKRLVENPRYVSTKVVKEHYDPDKGLFLKQTVYRSATVKEEPVVDPKEQAAENTVKRLSEHHRENKQRQAARLAYRRRLKKRKTESLRFIMNLILRLVIIGSLGIGILYWFLYRN